MITIMDSVSQHQMLANKGAPTLSSPQMIFINLPVRNLAHSVSFYRAIGFHQNPQLSDETSACMVLSDTIVVMLLTHSKWQGFTQRIIPDAHATAQVLLSLSRTHRPDVDDVIERGKQAGGKADPNPVQDHGCMYVRSLEDPDGHIWEWVWMDPTALNQNEA